MEGKREHETYAITLYGSGTAIGTALDRVERVSSVVAI